MPRRFGTLAAGLAGLLLVALPARADITVLAHYTLANGDTLTRASYYTSRRIRTTLPTGDEIIYNDSNKRIALVDHAAKRYWEGPKAQADSIAARLRSERASALRDSLTPEKQAEWNEIYAALTESLSVGPTGRSRPIAGTPCSEWVLRAGPYLTQERWVARSLAMPDFSRDLEKVVVASIMDPLGKGLMRLVLQGRGVEGLALAGRIRFRTLGQQGDTSWEAIQVLSGKIAPGAWAVPAGYERWQPPATGTGP